MYWVIVKLLVLQTALSISKLALLSTGGHSSAKTTGELEDINCELQRIEYIEKLPKNSLKVSLLQFRALILNNLFITQKIGVKDINDLPPLSPEDVIKVCRVSI